MINNYAKIYSLDQNLEMQIISLKTFCILKTLFRKKAVRILNGKNRFRLIKNKQVNLLILKNIDSSGRNYQMILEEWAKTANSTRRIFYPVDLSLSNISLYF